MSAKYNSIENFSIENTKSIEVKGEQLSDDNKRKVGEIALALYIES